MRCCKRKPAPTAWLLAARLACRRRSAAWRGRVALSCRIGSSSTSSSMRRRSRHSSAAARVCQRPVRGSPSATAAAVAARRQRAQPLRRRHLRRLARPHPCIRRRAAAALSSGAWGHAGSPPPRAATAVARHAARPSKEHGPRLGWRPPWACRRPGRALSARGRRPWAHPPAALRRAAGQALPATDRIGLARGAGVTGCAPAGARPRGRVKGLPPRHP